jgi:hypothetical protein
MDLSDASEKFPVTRPGIDPRIFRLVAQRLNRYATAGPSVDNTKSICRYIATSVKWLRRAEIQDSISSMGRNHFNKCDIQRFIQPPTKDYTRRSPQESSNRSVKPIAQIHTVFSIRGALMSPPPTRDYWKAFVCLFVCFPGVTTHFGIFTAR